MAETEFVAVLDDDVLPQRRWFEHAMRFIERHDPTTVVGSTGRVSNFNTSAGLACSPGALCAAFVVFEAPNAGRDSLEQVAPIEVDFVIHNYVARAGLLRFFFALPHYTWENGEDISFCAALQVAVGARCWMPPQSHADETMGDFENKGGVRARAVVCRRDQALGVVGASMQPRARHGGAVRASHGGSCAHSPRTHAAPFPSLEPAGRDRELQAARPPGGARGAGAPLGRPGLAPAAPPARRTVEQPSTICKHRHHEPRAVAAQLAIL
jgi:hypothetical protein